MHSRCFEEVALGLKEAFAALGFEAPVVTDPAHINGRAVVLGANLLPRITSPLPPGLILYNLEQVDENSPWLKSGYADFLKRYPVWDYSARNIERLKSCGIDAALCGIGYMPGLTRIPPAQEDIDVLFIGSMNPRRMQLLEQIARRGMLVKGLSGLYGEERDALVARAKIILNIHHYDAQLFEIVRVSYLLANRKCVVSETGRDVELETPLAEGVAFTDAAGLADTCFDLLQHPEKRTAFGERGFACFSALSQVPMLKRALGSLS